MKTVIVVTAMLLVAVASPSIEPTDDPGLPVLHMIRQVTLSPSYSCRSSEEFHRGYQQTALFLYKPVERRHRPDLLFNGGCNAPDYFQGSTAGDDMSLIADLGPVPLETLSAFLALSTANSKFAWQARVEQGHTYALLINKSDVRGLVIFAVTRYVPNRSVELRYAVKEYQLLHRAVESPGFNWTAANHPDSEPALRDEDCDPQSEGMNGVAQKEASLCLAHANSASLR